VEKESWKNVYGHDSCYAVSNCGRVKRTKKGKSTRSDKILSQHKNKYGYWESGLMQNGKVKTFRVHALVALSFLGMRPVGMHINHKDGCKENNDVSNLEYLTPRENVRHAHKLGLMRPVRGSKSPFAKLCELSVISLRKEYATGATSHRRLALKYDVSYAVIKDIVNRRSWKHV